MNDQFDQLVKDLGLEGAPRRLQEDIIAKLGETILKATIVTIAERASWRQRREFGKLIDNSSDPLEPIRTFITRHPEFAPLIEEVRKEEIKLLKEAVHKSEG
jgi:hypothetical protein